VFLGRSDLNSLLNLPIEVMKPPTRWPTTTAFRSALAAGIRAELQKFDVHLSMADINGHKASGAFRSQHHALLLKDILTVVLCLFCLREHTYKNGCSHASFLTPERPTPIAYQPNLF
jgi:hypothetical protein